MAETSVTMEGPAGREPHAPKDRSRRRLLKQAGAGAVLLVATGLVGKAVGSAVAEAAEKPSAGEVERLRAQFLDRAREALRNAHPMAGASVAELPDTAIVQAADPSGSWGTKVQTVALRSPDAPQTTPPPSGPAPDESILLRMQRDLQRAMQKPIDQRQWVMVIDLRKCIGCSACTVACKAENKLPPGVVYRPVIEEELGEYPNVTRRFIPRPCMQCENPPCVPVCPVGATYKRPDGIVEIDYNVCIGCRYCMAACPYGARYFDFGANYTEDTPAFQPYEQQPSLEYGQVWQREEGKSPEGNVRKCQFCLHRLAAGMLPACTTTCVGAATYFGDANDPDSLVSELISRPNVMRLKEELGTKPKVYYLL